MAQQWKTYESMSLSKDSTTSKQVICNVSEKNLNELSITEINNFLTNYDNNNDSSVLGTSSITQNTNYIASKDNCPPRWKREIDDTMSEFPSVQKQVMQKSNIINKNKNKNYDEDENYQFLMSFLPILRDVPKHRQLTVRHKLLKVFMNEEKRNQLANYDVNPTRYTPIPVRPPPPPYPKTEFNIVVPKVSSATPVNAVQPDVDYSFSSSVCNNNNNVINSTENPAETLVVWTY